jgi:hypothetical protein
MEIIRKTLDIKAVDMSGAKEEGRECSKYERN